MKTVENIQIASVRKTSSLLKKQIKQKFNTKVSVRSDSFSMGSSMDIKYDLGIDSSNLRYIKDHLQYGRFNMMIDLYEHIEREPLIIEGFKLNSYKFVSIEQHIPKNVEFELAVEYCEAMNYDIAPLKSIDELYKSFDGETFDLVRQWSWSGLFLNHFKIRNFPCQNWEEMKIASVDISKINDTGVVFEIEYKGQLYRTDQLPVRSSSNNKSDAIAFNEAAVSFVDYSDKSFAVIGETKKIKELLKSFGGRFNPRLKCGAGWIFQKNMEKTVRKALNI